MELTWPIDAHCWVAYGQCDKWCCHDYKKIDKQVFLSTEPDNGDCFAFICLSKNKPGTIRVCFRGYRKYDVIQYMDGTGDFIVDDESDKFVKDKSMQRWLDKSYNRVIPDSFESFKKAYRGEARYTFKRNNNAQSYDVGQRVIVAVQILPTPIANEIILHLRGSIRMILAEIG
jgi:hypothetical protein